MPKVEAPTPDQVGMVGGWSLMNGWVARLLDTGQPDSAAASFPTFCPIPQVEEYLQKFIGEMERMFKEHKAAAGHSATTLTIY